ncbi:MAG: alpha/beta hydrolase [Terricaulis sp.]
MDSGGHSFIGGFEERVVATVDGLALYARDYAPLEPSTGLPVICLHGLTRNSRDFEVIAPRIAALGRRVIVPDMRGRGRSANDPDPAHYVPTVYAQDVIALMDKLQIPQAVFLGTSMGGIITMLIGASSPERVAATILNDVGPQLDPKGIAYIASYVGRVRPLASWDDAADASKAVAGAAFPERADDHDFWLTVARRTYHQLDNGQVEADYDPHIALAFADLEHQPPADLTPLFQALVSKPMLSVRGAISNILSEDVVAQMRTLKPDLDTVEIANVGHAPWLDEPTAWDAVLDFLARTP